MVVDIDATLGRVVGFGVELVDGITLYMVFVGYGTGWWVLYPGFCSGVGVGCDVFVVGANGVALTSISRMFLWDCISFSRLSMEWLRKDILPRHCWGTMASAFGMHLICSCRSVFCA